MPYPRSAVGLPKFREVWIGAEALEGEVEWHSDRPEIPQIFPATAVRGIEQHDIVPLARANA